ncbi:hypothetical protein AWC38_SpisGene18362 [Stylophora pistillata]|uniref:Uncharacterized protein n=1 Tax=Stylophora pistillata TaxID=50429 RepID=A0A2B4RM16_STYPI|nr:hypothetical protein AWC38_SpisGene18362 [Stylophora pistillata]
MPSAIAFADMLKSALAPVLRQLTSLNENVSSGLLNGHDDSDEDGETASDDGPAKSMDMDADLFAPLASADKDEVTPGEDLLKELTQGFNKNVHGLRTPKVNPSIWSQLSTTIKAQDVRSQKGQNPLIGAITAITKAADLALGKYSQDKELITLLTDAVAMELKYIHEVNHSRSMAMKKEMHKDNAALCNLFSGDGTSEYLFRDLLKLAKVPALH